MVYPQPVVPAPRFPPVLDFPLEQSRDATLHLAYDQVMVIDCTWVHPDAVFAYPQFVMVRDRLHRVCRDQLLVPRSRREMTFQEPPGNDFQAL